MRLATRARYALARWALKGMTWQYLPTWATRTVLNGTFHALTRQGYQRAAAYFACVSAHAFTFPEPPLWIWDGEGDDASPIPNHPVRRLLMRPNPDQDEAAFKADVITWCAIGGNCYIHKLRNRLGQVVGLRAYHDGIIRPVPIDDEDGVDDQSGSLISHYLFRNRGGEEVRLDKRDVIHVRWPSPDPLKPWMSQAPILAAVANVDAVAEATRMVAALLANDAVPRTIITQSPQMALTPDEVSRMRAEFASQHGGVNRGGVAILEAGAGIERLGLGMDELDFSALHDTSVKQICAVMKVPAPVAGLGDDPTYANSEEASKRFTTDTRVPLWGRFAGAIQQGLADELGGAYARHYLGRVAVLQEDEEDKARRIIALFGAQLLGWRESRAQLGVMLMPDADDLFIQPMSSDLVRYAELGAAPPPPTTPTAPLALPAPVVADDDEPDEPDDEPDDDEQQPEAKAQKAPAHRRLAADLRRIRDRHVTRLARAIDADFAALAAEVRANATAQKDAMLPTVDELLPDGDWGLLATFRAALIELLEDSWPLWNAALDTDLAFDQSDPTVVALMAQAGDRIGGIQETTRSAVRDLLAYGAEQGWSIAQLIAGTPERRGLNDLVEQTYANRGRAIARSELGHGQNVASTQRYRAAGITHVIVSDNGFDDSHPECTRLNGTRQTLEWAERNPLQHPNCVRSFSPDV